MNGGITLNQNMVESQTPLQSRYVLEAIRQLANESGVYRINPGSPDTVDIETMCDYWREGQITISTWGIPVEELFPDLDAGDTITTSDINPDYQDPVTGGLDQDELTTLVETQSEEKSPGRAAGSLDRFFNDLTAGTGILGNMDGTAPGVVDGPVVYKPNGPARKASKGHVFVRPVTWAKSPTGGVLEMPHSELHSSLRPTPTTCTRLQNASHLLDLASFVGFFAEQSTN